MLFGHNTNLSVDGSPYHVQTEDRGVENALIDTTVFCRGRVLYRRTNNYFDLLPLSPGSEEALKLRLDEQHRAVLEEIRSGALHLASPPSLVDSKAAALAPAVPHPELALELTNPRTWLSGKHATLQVSVRDKRSGNPAPGAKVTARVEGSAEPFERSVDAGPHGQVLLDFDMPRLGSGDAALVIEASRGAARGTLRFQLRAKPRVPAAS
jgi:hypothetical protein